MVDTFFSYGMVTDDDVKFYKAVPGTMKITGIKATDKGVVNIPETIDGVPVTCYAGLNYFGTPIKKLILPKTLVALPYTECFPEIIGELVIDNDNPEWSTDGVSLLSKDGTRLLRMCQKNRASYTIPDGVTTICVYAFHFNNNVELTIPDSVTTVEGRAFEYCSSLKTVHGGKNIVNYESSSFDDTEWYRSSPVLVLGTTLLRFDSMEENVVVPDGIEIIGPNAFSSSGGKGVIMETVKLPSTVREIGEYAFSNKENLKAINFPDGLQTIRKGAFYGCQSLSEIVLPDSISEIGVKAFQGCSSVAKVVIPHAVSGTKDRLLQKEAETGLISAEAFSSCTALEHFDIPEGTVAIGASAFNNCRSLKSIRIPETVKAIGEEAFANCFELEELFLPASCVELGQNVFPSCNNRMGAISAKFSRIDVDPQNEAFSLLDGVLCSKNRDTLVACPAQYNVAEYTIPEGVAEILPGAFEGCEKIKKVVFAKTVEKIGARAFASKEAAEKEIGALAKASEEIRIAIDAAQKKLSECEKEMASLEAAKEEIRKRLDGAEDIDLEQESAKQVGMDSRLREIEKEEKTVHVRLSANSTALKNIQSKAGDLVAAEQKYTWVRALSNTANGSVTGKERIMLETYIQMHYFDRIIARANTRLMIMTGGQYDLVRRKESAGKSQIGLDLDVIDHYNGSQRSVKTLSGGESFKASLALALGLSDEIQASAGGIKLDTMFVDEGFGSLDDESLAQAIQALNSLADNDRLVGIISHVGDLKRKIDRQIVVTKDKTGGSRAEIVV